MIIGYFFHTTFDIDQCFLMAIGILFTIWQRESENVIVVRLVTSFPSKFTSSHFVYFNFNFFSSFYSSESEIVHVCPLILLSLELRPVV